MCKFSQLLIRLFAVDLLTFQKILEDLSIFVWKKGDGTLLRIHGGDYLIKLFIKDMRANNYIITVPSTFSFEAVRSKIENTFKLSPGCYKLSFKHRSESVGSVSVKTDRDWHFVVLFSKRRAYHVFLDLEEFPSSQTADEVACNELRWYDEAYLYEAASDEDASDEDASDVCCEKYVKKVFFEGAWDEVSRYNFESFNLLFLADLGLCLCLCMCFVVC